MFAVYRERRLAGEWLAKGRKTVKEATVNREQSYLHAVFSEMKRLGEWEGNNPLDGIRQFKEGEQELSFLYADEIKRLLAACDESENISLGIMARLCLATGARWGEAESMRQSQVLPGKVSFINTKSKKIGQCLFLRDFNIYCLKIADNYFHLLMMHSSMHSRELA